MTDAMKADFGPRNLEALEPIRRTPIMSKDDLEADFGARHLLAEGRNLEASHLYREFIQYLARYGRSYASKDDFDHRFSVFATNYMAI